MIRTYESPQPEAAAGAVVFAGTQGRYRINGGVSMNKNRKLAAVAIALSAFLTILPATYAAKSVSDLKKEMAETAEQKKKTAAEITQKENEKNAAIEQRNQLDMQITGVLDNIENVEGVIAEKDQAIDEKNEKIKDLQKVIDRNENKLKTRIRVMYEYGNVSYLELILDSKGLGDLFERISAFRNIVNHDKELINTYVNTQKEVEDAKAVIETEKKEQVEVKELLDGQKQELKQLQSEKTKVINSLEQDIKQLEAEEKQKDKDYDKLQAELNAAMAKSSGAAVVYKGNGKFGWPSASSTRVTSEFNMTRLHPILKVVRPHRGMDIGAPAGTSVLAAEAGKVMTAGWNNSYGYYITINHGGGYVTLYAHNSKLLVKAGDSVTRGQVIAKVGSTGNSTGPHIHFEVRLNGSYVNPRNYL